MELARTVEQIYITFLFQMSWCFGYIYVWVTFVQFGAKSFYKWYILINMVSFYAPVPLVSPGGKICKTFTPFASRHINSSLCVHLFPDSEASRRIKRIQKHNKKSRQALHETFFNPNTSEQGFPSPFFKVKAHFFCCLLFFEAQVRINKIVNG